MYHNRANYAEYAEIDKLLKKQCVIRLRDVRTITPKIRQKDYATPYLEIWICADYTSWHISFDIGLGIDGPAFIDFDGHGADEEFKRFLIGECP